MLESMTPGEEFEIWPRHITIVPWFSVSDEEQLDETLQELAKRHKSFEVKAGKVEEWGKQDKFEVQKIDDEGQLHRLHWDVFRSLEKNGFSVHQKDFLGQKYTPHISLRNRLQKGQPVKMDTSIDIKDFTLIKQERLKGSGRMIKSVVRSYKLQ